MKMANFLMPRNTAVSHVNAGAQSTATTALGTVSVRRGPIGDIAAVDGAVLVANHADDTVSVLDAPPFVWVPFTIHPS